MSRFIKVITSLIIILSLCGCGYGLVVTTQAYSVPYNETVSYTLDDLIAEQISNMNAAHQMAEAAR